MCACYTKNTTTLHHYYTTMVPAPAIPGDTLMSQKGLHLLLTASQTLTVVVAAVMVLNYIYIYI